jgi:hypothetical protein
MRLASKLCIGACLALLVLAAWPAKLEYVLIFAVLSFWIWFPATVVAVLVSAFREWRRPYAAAKVGRTRRWALFAGATAILTFAAMWWSLPLRLGFAASKSTFEARLSGPHASGRRCGLYRVDRREADPRGGVYFLTGTAPDFISPDRILSGFAHRPNLQGSPFGEVNYRLLHLGGDWYAFSAGDH